MPTEGFDAVIIADGDFPTCNIPLDILHNAKYLCCCDGAGMSLIEKGIMPDAIVGDGDSMSEEFKERYKDIIHVIEEQDYNDLTKCTKHVIEVMKNEELRMKNKEMSNHSSFLIPNSSLKIAYLGATGKREDHTLGNISLMAYYMQEFGIKAYMFTDHGIFIPAHGTQTFKSAPRLQVSIFNIDCTQIRSEGLRWDAYPYKQIWQGTLNEATGDHFTLHTDGTYIVFITYQPKV